MKYIFRFLILYLNLILTQAFAQIPEKPKSTFDAIDLEEAFNSLGFKIYNLPVKLPEGKYKIKLEIEYYKDGKSVIRKDLIDTTTQKIIPSNFRSTEKDSLIRMYVHQKNEEEILKIRIGKSTVRDTIKFMQDYLPYSDWKTIYWNPIVANKEIPILMKYVPKIEEINGQKFIRQCVPGLEEEEYHDFFSNYVVIRVKFNAE